MKKIILSSLVVLFMFSMSVSAQQEPVPPTNPAPQNFSTETFVHRLSIDNPEKTYKPGDTVTGQFIIMNGSSKHLDGVQHLIYIAGDINESFDHNAYGKAYSEKFSLLGSQSKQISFSFKIPDMISAGKKELTIRSIHNDIPYGQAHVPIEIAGGTIPLSIRGAHLTVLDMDFFLGNGPTLYPDRIGYFKGKFQPVAQSLKVTPVMTLYKDIADTGTLVLTQDFPTVTLGASVQEFSYVLPNDQAPGIYEAKFSFKDDKGIVRTEIVAHYIIGGTIATIQSVSFNPTTAKKGEVVRVTTEITGIPDDINNPDPDTTVVPVIVTVSLKDSKGQRVGFATSSANIGDVTKVTTPVVAEMNSKGFEGTVTVHDLNGTLLSTFSRISDEGFNNLEESDMGGKGIFASTIAIIGGLFALMILIFLVLHFVFHRKVGLFMVFFMFGSLLSFLTGASPADAQLVVSNPLPSQQIVVGSTFTLDGSYQLNQCRNSPVYYKVFSSNIIPDGGTFNSYPWTLKNNQAWGGDDDDHEWRSYSDNYAKYNYVAPSTPGKYFITVTGADWRMKDSTTRKGYKSYSITRYFDVVCQEGYIQQGSSCVPSNGICGTANATTQNSVPTSPEALCASGEPAININEANSQEITWQCPSSNGGTNIASCAASRCSSGETWNGSQCVIECTAPEVYNSATGQCETPPDCTQPEVPIDGVCKVPNNGACGTAHQSTSNFTPPTSSMCRFGSRSNAIFDSSSNRYIWSCSGNGSGSNAICSSFTCPGTQTLNATTLRCENTGSIDATCGTASTNPSATVPTSSLCSTPGESTILLNNESGGRLPVAATGVNWQSNPAIANATSSSWTWLCAGSNGGASATCSTPRCATGQHWYVPTEPAGNTSGSCQPNPECVVHPESPTFSTWPANKCQSGKGTAVELGQNAVDFTWFCESGGQEKSCRVRKTPSVTPVSGICSSPSVINTCASGSPLPAITDTPADSTTPPIARWTCPGTNGGDSPSCEKVCQGGQVMINGNCMPPTSCTPSFTEDTYRRVVDDVDDQCPFTWSVANDDDNNINTATTCNQGGITCTRNGSPIATTTQELPIGTHILTCTNSNTGLSRTYSPSPSCRLNSSYGEF